jgi:hypothetical protein
MNLINLKEICSIPKLKDPFLDHQGKIILNLMSILLICNRCLIVNQRKKTKFKSATTIPGKI